MARTALRDGLMRRRVATPLLYLLGAGLFVLLGLEAGLRLFLPYDPSFYAVHEDPEPGKVVSYEYGEIRYNREGFPDDEFEPERRRRRVGYVGDSVCFGIGAGHGHRVSEILEALEPRYEHLNFCRAGWWLHEKQLAEVAELAERFQLDAVLYLMNLNDLHPGRTPELLKAQEERRTLRRLRNLADELRGRSYLYTHLRTALKNRFVRQGFREDGQFAYEFFPAHFAEVYAATALRVRRLADLLAHQGVGLGVVLLPYEMQISSQAEARYRELGIRWEGAFLSRGPQRVLAERLRGLRVLDAYWAFVARDDVEGSRARNALGQYFVYDRGDRIDWNHLNRAGHLRVAEQLHAAGWLPTLVGDSARPLPHARGEPAGAPPW
jgi:hypothetical protein